MDWYTYILECADGTLYTGITTDIQKRVRIHNQGKASKYTRSRLPVTLKWCENQVNESAARKREFEIKQLPRYKKVALFQTK